MRWGRFKIRTSKSTNNPSDKGLINCAYISYTLIFRWGIVWSSIATWALSKCPYTSCTKLIQLYIRQSLT